MATNISFVHEFSFDYGASQQVTPMIRRVIAKNPGPFTFRGTGTYIIGSGQVAIIDPGPLDQEHIDSLLRAVEGETVTHILITHTHQDHSPAAEPLKKITGAKTYGFGPHGGQPGNSLEGGADWDFSPDIRLVHGDVVSGEGWTLSCVHTPGHTSNHMCYQLVEEKALFSGDHVMGWSTSVIGPPDGNMTDYMNSLELLLHRDDEIYWPTHGTCINDPKAFVQSFIDHRLERENQILACLDKGVHLITEMVPIMYADTDKQLHGAAARSVLAAMERLVDTGQVACDGEPDINLSYRLI